MAEKPIIKEINMVKYREEVGREGGILLRTIALVGTSGTGKSYRALTLAYEKKIEFIIDDGLLIRKNKVIAGKSAKREETAVGAVKRALFMNEDHRILVRDSLADLKPEKILVIGTSDKMVLRIASQLGIDPIDETIYIEQIASPEEIKMATKQRRDFGKHVIPVPTFEIKEDFSGYFIDPLKILRKRKDNTVSISEKSVVRPTFSYMGKYIISDKVIRELAAFAAEKIVGISKVSKIDVFNYTNGIVINMDVMMTYGIPIRPVARAIQQQIKSEVEYMTALNILAINIGVKKLIINK